MTPGHVLQTVTLNPARFMGLTAELGTVEEGKLADLLLLSANPLEDIRNTREIMGVMKGGNYHTRAELDARLEEVKERARHWAVANE